MQSERNSDWSFQALNVARIVFYAADAATGFTLRSDSNLEILGVESSGMTAQWHDGIFPQDRPKFDDAMRALSPAAPRYQVEYRIVHPSSKKLLWLLDRGEAQFNGAGKQIGRRGAIVDVSAAAGSEDNSYKEARLRSVAFEAARMATWHLDAQSNRLSCTDELLSLLDIDRQQFDGTRAAVEGAIHPDDLEAWRNAHETAAKPGGKMEFEFRVLLQRGGIRWLLSRGEIVHLADGAVLESYGVMIDITERKVAEEAASRLAAIVASSEDAIVSKTLLGVITSWNHGAERLFGYTAKEMIGWSISRLLPPENAHEEVEIIRTIREGGTISPYESIRLHKNGRGVHVSIAVSPIRNAQGIVVGASTIARDVTERRKHIETLRQNEARLRLALKSARAGAWDYDLQKRELHWSPEMFDLYGLDATQSIPTREILAGQISQNHRKRARKEFSKAMLQGGSFTLEFPIIRPDGKEIWTALVGDVVKDRSGRPVSARGIDQDITERKNWEKRQAILLRELSHRVKNTLAVIQSVARQTLRSSSTPKAFVEAFDGRIRSLAASHSLLTEADWSGAKLDVVIHSQVDGLVENFAQRFKLRGPEVILAAESATQLGLVVHELATNAAKFGALSLSEGRVDVLWTVSRGKLRLIWRERGGPALTEAPTHSGFGTLLILSSALKVSRRFDPEGLTCKLEIAL